MLLTTFTRTTSASCLGTGWEAIDVINRDLTDGEVEHLRKLGKLREESVTAAQAQEETPLHYVQSTQSRNHGDVPVSVDILKLDTAHAQAQPDSHVGPEGAGGIEGRYQRFSEWLNKGESIEMPEMNFDWAGRPQFINGRHRFAVLRDKGRKTIEVAVPPDQVKKFQETFGPESITAAQQVQPVQDEHDVVSAPLSPRGHLTRVLSVLTGVKEEGGYKTEGHWKAAGKFNDLIWEAMKTKVQNGKALITNAAFLNTKYLDTINKV